MIGFVRGAALGGAALMLMVAGAAEAQTRVTLKSAASTSSYYVMMVQLAELLRAESDGEILPTVEESQGSVQNLREAAEREGPYLFTTPPNLIDQALAGEGPYEGLSGFEEVRTLFTMPFITVHLVVGEESGITDVTELSGHSFIAGGTGTACEGQTMAILEALGIDDIDFADVELNNAGPAMRNNRVTGFATCSAHPTPQLVELATSVDIEILSFTDEQREAVMAAFPAAGPVTIAAGTYAGQDEDVATFGTPVGAYTTTQMDDDTAYFITSTFWAQREGLAQENPWWAGVTPDLVTQLGAPMHPGAARYYEEIGVDIPEAMLP